MSTVELFPANPDILEDADNLIKLSYLNEPSVLYNLRCRYSKDEIYVCYYVYYHLFVISSLIYLSF